MTVDLPNGTVTFLFTDVEGSTRLLEALGAERYAEALTRHRRIVRAALVRHEGVEVDTQGDAFFCAFALPRAAVACASEIQDQLADGPIRLRMGIHTGEALVVDRHYVGMEVHRAARVGACGHGGQVVISSATVDLLDGSEFALRSLGAHRLKDLSAPVGLYQLGDGAFPPLNTLFRTNLPVPATPFLGREHELRELVERANSAAARVLTLTGPGGTGKTRLALQLAAEISDSFPDGTWWISLAPLREESAVASAVASVLGVEEEAGTSLTASIATALAQKRALVLLDNCEHVLDAAADVAAAVVGASPGARVLATSREALGVAGEQVVSLEPLVPDDAVGLFYARAESAGAQLDRSDTHESVLELCARVDNLPLAIELAAARTPLIAPAALLERLTSSIDVLKGRRGAEERQRTLRATIAWSHGLLDETEQVLFRKLSVFTGGGELSAIEEVCEADLDDLLSLVAKSLVRHTTDGHEPRYWMLETIREFAREELDSSVDRDEVERRHAEWFRGLARRAFRELDGPASGEWLAVLDRDLENVRAAFAWLEREQANPEAGADLGLALVARHFFRGRYAEARDLIGRTIAFAPGALGLADLQSWLASVLRLQGDARAALAAYEDAERTLDAVATRDDAWWHKWLALEIAKATFFYFENRRDELDALVRTLQPLVAEHGAPVQELELLHLLTQQAYRRERYAPSEATEALARNTYRKAIELDGIDADFLLGFCLLWRGKLEEAEECFLRGRETARERGSALVETRCLVYGSIARRRRNDLDGTREWVEQLEQQDELHGYVGLVAANAAWLALRTGDLETVARRAADAFADWHRDGSTGSPFEWTARFPLFGAALAHGDVDEACDHLRANLDPSLQPLPRTLEDAVSAAVAAGTAAALADTLGVARSLGYA